MDLKKSFLLLFSISIAGIGLLYGASPQFFAQTFLGTSEISVDFTHVLRAVMGLYLALGGYWFYAAFTPEYRNSALLSIMLLGGVLALARIISVLIDGVPSTIFVVYIFLEIPLVPVVYWLYKQPD